MSAYVGSDAHPTGDRSIRFRPEHSQLTARADERRRPDDDARARLDERTARRIARVGCIFEPRGQVRRVFPVAHRSFAAASERRRDTG